MTVTLHIAAACGAAAAHCLPSGKQITSSASESLSTPAEWPMTISTLVHAAKEIVCDTRTGALDK